MRCQLESSVILFFVSFNTSNMRATTTTNNSTDTTSSENSPPPAVSSDYYGDTSSDEENNTDQPPCINYGKGNAYQYRRDLKFSIWSELGSEAWDLKVLGSLVKMGLGAELDDSLKRLLWGEHPYKEIKGNNWVGRATHKGKINQFIALILFNSGTLNKAMYQGRFVLCNTTLVVTDDESADEWMRQLKDRAPDICTLKLPNPKHAKHRIDLFHVVVTTYSHMNETSKDNSQLWNCKFRRVIFDNHSDSREFKKFLDSHSVYSDRQWCLLHTT